MKPLDEKKFQRHEQVQLTRKAAAVFASSPKSKIGKGWFTRVGSVISCNMNSALVLWHGIKSPEQWPVKALEKAEQQ